MLTMNTITRSLTQLHHLTQEITRDHKLSYKNISRMHKVITSIANSRASMSSSEKNKINEKLQYSFFQAKKTLFQSASHRKSDKNERLNKIAAEVEISDCVKEFISSKAKILSEGIEKQNGLNKVINESMRNSLYVVDDAINMLRKHKKKALLIVEKNMGLKAKNSQERKELISLVKSNIEQYSRLISEYISENGKNITTFANNSNLPQFATVFNSLKRIFIGDQFATLTLYKQSRVFIHEVSHLFGSNDFWYVHDYSGVYKEGREEVQYLSEMSSEISKNLNIAHINKKREMEFIKVSGEKSLEDAVSKFHTDVDFKKAVTINNADTISILAMELHYAFLTLSDNAAGA